MILKPTALIYSSHDRGEYLHKDWIVQRALDSWDNKTILYLPFSMVARNDQEYSWGTFKKYFDNFTQFGLRADVFFYSPDLSYDSISDFIHMVKNHEVVILGGGRTFTGFEQLDSLGVKYCNDFRMVKNLLQERQANGKLTVGFSAGALQLSDACIDDAYHAPYSLMHNITAVLHHDVGRRGELNEIAYRFPHCLAFGLPNDSGIAANYGQLPSGNKWQILQFIVDNSWDRPEDAHHIKTRQGINIEHVYADGRTWNFNGGDIMVRIFSPDYAYQGSWVIQPNNPVITDYWTQQPTGYHNIEHILSNH